MIDERSLSPKQWAQLKRKELGLELSFEWNEEQMSRMLRQLPNEHRTEAERVWRARVGKPISDIHEQTITEYIKDLKWPHSLAPGFTISAEQFIMMPTSEFNAFAGHTPRGDQIVVLHQALSHVVKVFCDWFLFGQEEANQGRAVSPNLHQELEQYFLAVWFSDPTIQTRPNAYPRSKNYWDLSEQLTFAVMRFILAHEIGHLYHDHKGYSGSREFNHQMEYEADSFALHSCVWTGAVEGIKADDNYVSLYNFLGPFFGLSIISLLGNNDTHTHPSCQKRIVKALTEFDRPFTEATEALGLGKEKFIEFLGDGDRFMSRIETMTTEALAMFSQMRPAIMQEIATRPPTNEWLKRSLNRLRQS